MKSSCTFHAQVTWWRRDSSSAPRFRLLPIARSPSKTKDYRPPFPTNAVRADGDGNLWVRINTAKPVQGGSIFDIINGEGVLVDRIQVPTGFTIAGFGAGKIVYAVPSGRIVELRKAAGM